MKNYFDIGCGSTTFCKSCLKEFSTIGGQKRFIFIFLCILPMMLYGALEANSDMIQEGSPDWVIYILGGIGCLAYIRFVELEATK